jgi:sulfur relay (sulfurtransferase) complex TusBCD TusD component (DsrE family)
MPLGIPVAAEASGESAAAMDALDGWEAADVAEIDRLPYADTGVHVPEVSSKGAPDDAAQQGSSKQQLQGDGVPLHACWAALLARMATSQDRTLVVAMLQQLEGTAGMAPPLLNLQEALQVMDAATAAGAF